jgi:hypothetical protein
MPLSIRHKLGRLPKRLPVGTTFVVEGRTVPANGKNNEHLRVFSRFVVLPGGRRIDLGGDATGLTRGRRPRRRSRQSAVIRASANNKKIISEPGTTLRQRR